MNNTDSTYYPPSLLYLTVLQEDGIVPCCGVEQFSFAIYLNKQIANN